MIHISAQGLRSLCSFLIPDYFSQLLHLALYNDAILWYNLTSSEEKDNMIKEFNGLLYEYFNEIKDDMNQLDLNLLSFKVEDDYLLDIKVEGSDDNIKTFERFLNGTELI